VAVKSLRVGWPTGLHEAEKRLGKSKMQYQLVCGIFEDVFPPEAELASVMTEVKALDYESLCSRETVHGRGLAGPFCDQPMTVADSDEERLQLAARRRGVWLPKRAYANFSAWLALKPTDEGVRRELDPAPWMGVPVVAIDLHTGEGRQRRAGVTLLSGTCEQHRLLGERVMREGGWSLIRAEAHAVNEPLPQPALWGAD
jgi:hypothetical protein